MHTISDGTPTDSARRFHWLLTCNPVKVFTSIFALSCFPLSAEHVARLTPLSDGFGCVGGTCWAGVYVDSLSKEILHLEPGGRAFFSPGTAAGAGRGILWWKAKEDILHIVDSDDQPMRWPGSPSDLRRDPLQAGQLAGFGVNVKTNSASFGEDTHLVRDSLGFMFPGCTYVLSMRPGSPRRATDGHEYRVVVNEDGTVTDMANGIRIARWTFPAAKPLVGGGDELWATGDEVLLVVESAYLHVRTTFPFTDKS